MKLLRKIFSVISLVIFCTGLTTGLAVASSVVLTAGSAAPGASIYVSLAPLQKGVVYSLTCPISIANGPTDFIAASVGSVCPTLGCNCEFNKPRLNNGGVVGPKNGLGAYQLSINSAGLSNIYTSAVTQIGTNDSIIFTNLEQTQPTPSTDMLVVGNCTATVVTSNAGKH